MFNELQDIYENIDKEAYLLESGLGDAELKAEELQSTLDEIRTQLEAGYEMKPERECRECGGSGLVWDISGEGPWECYECNGKGKIRIITDMSESHLEDCMECHGTGLKFMGNRINPFTKYCPNCNGTGRIKEDDGE